MTRGLGNREGGREGRRGLRAEVKKRQGGATGEKSNTAG